MLPLLGVGDFCGHRAQANLEIMRLLKVHITATHAASLCTLHQCLFICVSPWRPQIVLRKWLAQQSESVWKSHWSPLSAACAINAQLQCQQIQSKQYQWIIGNVMPIDSALSNITSRVSGSWDHHPYLGSNSGNLKGPSPSFNAHVGVWQMS